MIGSYPFPGWLEFAAAAPRPSSARTTVAELQDDAVIAAVHDQVAAGLDVITDGEQTRLDFNLSFYGYLEGIELERRAAAPLRAARARPARQASRSPASCAPRAASARSPSSSGCGASRRAGAGAESERARPVHAERPAGPERANTPIAGRSPRRCCRSCATSSPHCVAAGLRGDQRRRAVDELLRLSRRSRAASSISSTARSSRSSARCRLSTHLCFGNYKGARRRAAALRADVPRVPRFRRRRDPRRDGEPRVRRARDHRRRSPSASDVAVGIIDVKSYYIETARGRRRSRAPLPPATRRPSGSRSRPTAACARPRAGRRGRSSRTSSRACRLVRKEKGLVIEPALADDAFLADIAAAAAGFAPVVAGPERVPGAVRRAGFCSLDPYLSDSLTKKYAATDKPHVRMTARVVAPERLDFIDVVTSSHSHTDHLDAETLGPLLRVNPGLRLVIPEANRAFVAERLKIDPSLPIGIDEGARKEVAGFHFTGVPSAHEELEQGIHGLCDSLRGLDPLPSRRHGPLRREWRIACGRTTSTSHCCRSTDARRSAG